VRKFQLKRFDLLRSPLLLLAVGVLLLNDFVLKAAFHDWLTGKLSDVAGLAAFTIFCCALWPRHVRAFGGAITVPFAFWKSPYASGAIEAANAVLPFAIGRTVDYGDLSALPVVWLVCGNAHRLPLIDVGKIGVWLTACVCLFAFTATSSVDEHKLARVSELTRPATDAGIQSLFDRIAAQQGLECQQCDLPPLGRSYRSTAPPYVSLDLSFDVDPPQRLYFNVFTLTFNEKLPAADRQRVDRVAEAVEAALKADFPGLEVQPWTAPQSRRFWIDLRLGPLAAKPVEHGEDLVGHRGDAVIVRQFAFVPAGAGLVVSDDAIARLERCELRRPVAGHTAQARREQDGRASGRSLSWTSKKLTSCRYVRPRRSRPGRPASPGRTGCSSAQACRPGSTCRRRR
jgi:hypothetical protein